MSFPGILPFCSVSPLPGNPEGTNFQSHTLPPHFILSTDLEAMDSQPWTETSEVMSQNKPFLFFLLIFLGCFVTVTETNIPSRTGYHLPLTAVWLASHGWTCSLTQAVSASQVPGSCVYLFSRLLSKQRGHPVMSPHLLFWAVSFPNYNHKPWCGTGSNRLPIHYTWG